MKGKRRGVFSIVTEHGERGVLLHWHWGQNQAWDSEAQTIVVLAGVQSGKTVFGPHWLAREISRTADPEGHENDYIAATATYRLFSRKMLPALLEVFEHVLRIGRYWAQDQVIELCEPDSGKFLAKKASDPMWGRVLLGAAAAAGGLESATARACWTDEWGMDEVDNLAQDAIESRLAIRQGRQLVTTTAYNVGLIKVRFWDPWKGGDPDYEVINFESIANPAFPRKVFEKQRAKLPTWRFDMRYRGLLTRPAGIIYGDFEDSYSSLTPVVDEKGAITRMDVRYGGHLVRPFSIPQQWLRRVGVDFGGSLNNAQIWAAEEPGTGNYYLYREVAQVDETGPEQARAAAEYKEPVTVAYGGSGSEDDQRRQWAIAGFPVAKPWIAELEAGIDCVIGLFKERRLFVFDTLTGLRSELGTYSRELDDAGEPLQKIANKERFHELDAARYLAGGIEIDRPVIKVEKQYDGTERTFAAARSRREQFAERETEEYGI